MISTFSIIPHSLHLSAFLQRKSDAMVVERIAPHLQIHLNHDVYSPKKVIPGIYVSDGAIVGHSLNEPRFLSRPNLI